MLREDLRMNKKIIALIIFVVVIVGGYASYYAYASTVLAPQDLNTFKSEFNATNISPISESQIKDLENSADMVENYNALALVPQSQRDSIAQQMTSGNGNYTSLMNDVKNNFTKNQEISQRYDLMFRGDVAQEIRSVYSNETINLIEKAKNNADKQVTDIKSGDSKAYANDLREFASLLRQINTNIQQAHTHLNNTVNMLGG